VPPRSMVEATVSQRNPHGIAIPADTNTESGWTTLVTNTPTPAVGQRRDHDCPFARLERSGRQKPAAEGGELRVEALGLCHPDIGGAVLCQISRTTIWMIAPAGIARRTATNPPMSITPIRQYGEPLALSNRLLCPLSPNNRWFWDVWPFCDLQRVGKLDRSNVAS